MGTSKKWNGSTVFWQIDNLNRHRTGKIMLYNTINGKRFKKPYNHISWVHKALKIDNYNLKQCLFGLHLVSGTNKSIAIVESEKTALTMKLFLPEYTWIATGSKQNLKYELLYPIKNHKIILYPDKGEYNDWNKKCSELIGQGFNISCSQLVENSKGKKGTDLADIYFQLENEASQKPVLTNIENKLHKLHSKNPKIKSLIEAFCLTDEGGNIIKLIDYNGKKVVLFFYPKASTPGCTVEACNLRDNYTRFIKNGYEILGVSADSAKRQQNFIDKYNLPFPLLADVEKTVINAYKVWGPKKFMGREYDGIHRTTFVIDEKGIIEEVITKVKTKEHSTQLLGD